MDRNEKVHHPERMMHFNANLDNLVSRHCGIDFPCICKDSTFKIVQIRVTGFFQFINDCTASSSGLTMDNDSLILGDLFCFAQNNSHWNQFS